MLSPNDQNLYYARIDLSKTNYTSKADFKIIINPNIDELQLIFKKYCNYKKFLSVEPMWENEFIWNHNDVVGYYDDAKLVAWSVVTKYNKDVVYAVQFAWDYVTPKLSLGRVSLENECAFYKDQGYKYYYLGEAHKYKSEFDGFELLGKI
tara:strand:- start:7 stop:456 length:450 start_codon:yes stop_codon:yes gene_type:complete